MQFWNPPQIWKDKTCFIFGSGPSLNQRDVDRLRGQHVIAVNSSHRLAPWADILFFRDAKWFEGHRAAVEEWPGLVVATARTAARSLPAKVKLVFTESRPDFPPPGCGVIRHGRSSGHIAASLAVAMSPRKVALVGFDMRLESGRSHFNNEYKVRDPSVYSDLFVPGFDGWDKAAKKLGVEIVNATPNSAIKEFRFQSLDEIL